MKQMSLDLTAFLGGGLFILHALSFYLLLRNEKEIGPMLVEEKEVIYRRFYKTKISFYSFTSSLLFEESVEVKNKAWEKGYDTELVNRIHRD